MSKPVAAQTVVARPAWISPVGPMCCGMGMWAAYAYAWQRAQALAEAAERARFDPSWN